jgi:uncharacterized protein (TIGR00725 family)
MNGGDLMQIGVIGPFGTKEGEICAEFSESLIKKAERIGELIAERGMKLVCGGDDKKGVIEAVARGAKMKGGLVIGLLVGNGKSKAMEYVDVKIPTGMTYGGREYILALSCDSIIVIGGGSGTLNEITVAYQNRIPMVALKKTGGWTDMFAGKYLDWRKKEKIYSAETPEEAVEKAIKLAKRNIQGRPKIY